MPMSEYRRQLREKIGPELLMSAGVSTLIFDEQRRVLMEKRADTGAWGILGGGADPDETVADTCVREMWEETGLIVEPVRVIGVYGGPHFHIIWPNGDELSVVETAFEARIVGGELRPDGVETLDVAYFSQSDLAELALPRWARQILADAFDPAQHTHFESPTWRPPVDGVRKGGMSDYVRRLREKVGHDLLIMPAAGAVVRDERGRVLLQQRADDGWWSAPAGAMDPHESPADAVVRETWEETGLLVEPVRVTGVYGGPQLYTTYDNGDQIAVFSIVFECRVVGGDLSADGQEALDARFFSPEEVTGDFLPKRWRCRMADALAGHDFTCFDPPTWQPPEEQL